MKEQPLQNTPTTPPLTWNEIKSIINENKLEKLGRSKEQLNSYITFKHEILQEWDSIVSYILCTKFHYDKKNINDKWTSHPPASNQYRICFSLNDHPYYFESEIEHWVLWKLNGDITLDEIMHYKDILMSIKDREAIDTLHWMNPVSLKSIPGKS